MLAAPQPSTGAEPERLRSTKYGPAYLSKLEKSSNLVRKWSWTFLVVNIGMDVYQLEATALDDTLAQFVNWA